MKVIENILLSLVVGFIVSLAILINGVALNGGFEKKKHAIGLVLINSAALILLKEYFKNKGE